MNDIENDEDVSVEETTDGYIITTKVNYSNNKDLESQKIYVDEKTNITKVEVLNNKGIVKIKMTYDKIDTNPSFDKNYFELNSNITESNSEEKTTSKIEDIIYPLYLPDNTVLKSQETVQTEDGERIILTFAGDSSFTLIEQTISPEDEFQTISVYGELEFINDTIGFIDEDTVSWISNGIEYYAVSSDMSQDELLEVANSVNVITVGK
jgi:hypothetical protein